MVVQKQSTVTTQTINFVNGSLDTASLDTFIDTDTYAKINQWYDQIGSCDSAVESPVAAPWIGKSVSVGTKRALVFNGGSDVGNVHGLTIDPSCLPAKNITAQDYTVFMVVRPTSSIYRNQAFTPGLGTGSYISLESSTPVQITGNTSVGVPQITNATPGAAIGMVVSTASNGPFPNPVLISNVVGTTITLSGANALTSGTGTSIYITTPNTRIYANGDATPGGIGITDLSAFTFQTTDRELETGSIVLAVTSNSTGVKQWQNENIRTISSRSARSVTSTKGFIGRMGLSVQSNFGVAGSCQANTAPCGPYSLSGDFYTVAILVYNYGMTPQQRAVVSSALYQKYGLSPGQSESNPMVQKNFIMVGDSIPAGYSAFGRYGMVPRLQDLFTVAGKIVRFGNYSVPGSQVTASVGTPNYGYTVGMYPLSIAPVQSYSKQKNVLFVLAGGNDMIDLNTASGNVSVASPGVVTRIAHGMSAGMRVQFNTGPLPSPLSIGPVYFVKTVLTPDTYTIATTPSGNAINTTGSPAVGVTIAQYTKTAASIFAGIQNLVAQGVAAGASKVFVSTVLPRTGNPYLFVLDDTNTLIRAGAGYDLVDLAAVSCLSNPVGSCYDDGTHLSDLGMQTAADAMYPQVNTYFGP